MTEVPSLDGNYMPIEMDGYYITNKHVWTVMCKPYLSVNILDCREITYKASGWSPGGISTRLLHGETMLPIDIELLGESDPEALQALYHARYHNGPVSEFVKAELARRKTELAALRVEQSVERLRKHNGD